MKARKVRAYAIFAPSAAKRKLVLKILENNKFDYNKTHIPDYIVTYKNPEQILQPITGIKILRITDRYHSFLTSPLVDIPSLTNKVTKIEVDDIVKIKKGVFEGLEGKVIAVTKDNKYKVIVTVWGIDYENTFAREEIEPVK